jgi:hypothetical protein
MLGPAANKAPGGPRASSAQGGGFSESFFFQGVGFSETHFDALFFVKLIHTWLVDCLNTICFGNCLSTEYKLGNGIFIRNF